MTNNNGETIVGDEDRICPLCDGPKSAYANKCRECFVMEIREQHSKNKKNAK